MENNIVIAYKRSDSHPNLSILVLLFKIIFNYILKIYFKKGGPACAPVDSSSARQFAVWLGPSQSHIRVTRVVGTTLHRGSTLLAKAGS